MADIALIDISELTENIQWELVQATKLLSRDRLVLVRKEGSSAVASDLEVRPGVIVYPSALAGFGLRRGRQIVETAKRIRVELAQRLDSVR